MQLISRCYPTQTLLDLEDDLKFLLVTLPDKIQTTNVKYGLNDIADAIHDPVMNRYLSQIRSCRLQMLSFATSGIFQQDTRNIQLNVFRILQLNPIIYGRPFVEAWPDQLALLGKLEVALLFDLTLIGCYLPTKKDCNPAIC